MSASPAEDVATSVAETATATAVAAAAAAATLTGAGSGPLQLRGELTFATVPQLYQQGRRAIDQGGGELAIDLSGVGRADSAGLALLIDWLAYAAGRQCALRYSHLPKDITALAGLSEVTDLLRA
jgi:phospholipid transport system transporter-binding protein